MPGAALIAVGMFSLVFALSEGGIYGWITPIKDFTVAGHVVWPATRAISVIPFFFAVAVVALVALRRRRAGEGTHATATRSSSSRTCASRPIATGCSPAS